jgi:hypothetical protein
LFIATRPVFSTAPHIAWNDLVANDPAKRACVAQKINESQGDHEFLKNNPNLVSLKLNLVSIITQILADGEGKLWLVRCVTGFGAGG